MPQLAFQGVAPLRMIGVNGTVPFCSIISEGKLIYSAGNSIVLENTRTKQQKILYTHPHIGSIHLIHHHVTLYNEHLLAIATKQEHIQMNAITIVPLNAALFHLEERKEVVQTHYLKHIEQYETIEAITFFEEGSLLGVISAYENQTTFALLRTSNGDLLFQESHTSTQVKMRAANLNKQSCISLMLQNQNEGARLCLMAVDQLSRRYFYNLKLNQDEQIIEYAFETFQEETLYLMALTTEGCILIFKINQYQADLTIRIDVRINTGTFEEALESMDTMPNQIQASGNKIVVAYEQSKVLALLQFSAFNPSNYKFIVLSETLQKYTYIRSTHSIRVSKDGCTLAGLFLISNQANNTTASAPYTCKTVPFIAEDNPRSRVCIPELGTMRALDIKPQKQYIALQIDLLSNQIDNTDRKCTVEQTLSVCAGHAIVHQIQYCPHNNTMFLLLHNKALKYYSLTPRFGLRGKLDFQIPDLLLWTNCFQQQPISLTTHPFNFSMVLIYEDIIKFHNYNSKRIFPAFIVTSLKNCKLATYSPLGDKLVLATPGSLIVIDSYTFRTIRVLPLPNLVISPLTSSVTSMNRQAGTKNINSMHFLSNDELMLLSGHNTISIVLNLQKTVHFGLFEGDGDCRQTVIFDKINNLAIVAVNDVILVLSKSFNNTSNKCSLIAKFQISASALFEIAKLGVLFIGTEDGTLIMLNWPEYAQQDLYTRESSKLHLFNEPIISIKITPSMRFLYAVSLSGSIAICELQVGDSDSVASQYKRQLIKLSQIPLRQMNCWLMSQYEEQRKQRDIIKLRGQEADNTNQHANIGKEFHSNQEQLIKCKKVELQEAYLTQIKNYQEKLGIQKLLHSITMLRDELKMMSKERERNLKEINQVELNELNAIFKQRNNLQHELDDLRRSCQHQKYILQKQLKNQIKFLGQDFDVQTNLIKEKTQQVHLEEQQKFKELQMKQGSAKEEKNQTIQILRGQFQIDHHLQKEIRQAVLSRNRNTNIAIHSLQDKMSQLNAQKQKLQYDLIKVSQEREQLQSTQQQLQSILRNQQGAYDKLIRKSRQQESDLIQQRRLANRDQNALNEIIEQITILQKKQNDLSESYQKMNAEFVQLKEHHHNTTVSVKQHTTYLNSLKEIKKNKYYQKCLGKTRCGHTFRTLARQLQVDEGETIQQLKATLQDKQEEIQENELGRQFVQRQSTNNKLTLDALRWRQVKQCYLVGYRRSYHKLNGQNIKLTYQYNDLLKVQQQYKTYIIYMLEKIKTAQKDKENQQLSNFNIKSKTKHNDPIMTPLIPQKHLKQTAIRKKAVCLSLHQETGKFITEL